MNNIKNNIIVINNLDDEINNSIIYNKCEQFFDAFFIIITFIGISVKFFCNLFWKYCKYLAIALFNIIYYSYIVIEYLCKKLWIFFFQYIKRGLLFICYIVVLIYRNIIFPVISFVYKKIISSTANIRIFTVKHWLHIKISAIKSWNRIGKRFDFVKIKVPKTFEERILDLQEKLKSRSIVSNSNNKFEKENKNIRI